MAGKDIICLWICLTAYISTSYNGKAMALRKDLSETPEQLKSVFALDKAVGEALRFFPSSNLHAQKYLESYGRLAIDAQTRPGGLGNHQWFLGHPIHVFSMLKRLVLYYPYLKDVYDAYMPVFEGKECKNYHLFCELWRRQGLCHKEVDTMVPQCPVSCGTCETLERYNAVKRAKKKTHLPSVRDLTQAAKSIGIMQKFYELQIEDLMRGKVMDYYSSAVLDEWDCIRIGYACKEANMYATAYMWFEHIHRTTTEHEVANHAREQMDSIIQIHDRTFADTEHHFLHPLSTATHQNVRSSTYSEICLKETLQFDGNLRCRMVTRRNPYLILQPLKQETLSKDPEIYVYHDVVTEAEIREVNQVTIGKLHNDQSPEKIARIAYLSNGTSPIVHRIVRRTQVVSGLVPNEGDEFSMRAAPLQIRYYGVGGHAGPHTDAGFKYNGDRNNYYEEHGEKMATLKIYLNDVTEGGKISFYNIGLSWRPVKGAALLYYNLKRNGDYDARLDHGECPVVMGYKMVVHKTFLEHWNFRTRTCSKYPDK